MKKTACAIATSLFLLQACSSTTTSEAIPPKSGQPAIANTTNEVPITVVEKPAKKEAEAKAISRSTGLGDTLTYYAASHGDNAGDETFGIFMNGFLLPMFVEDRAVEVRLAFETTSKPRRTEEEAWDMVADYYPEDSKKTKEFKAEGIKGAEYESETIAKVFEEMYKGSGPIDKDSTKPGTFNVYLKYDKDGVYSAVVRVGRWKE